MITLEKTLSSDQLKNFYRFGVLPNSAHSNLSELEEKTMNPDQLRNFYRIDEKGLKRYITHQEIADRMNFADARTYRGYLFDKSKSSYRKPPNSILRLSWYIAQELFNEGWKI